MRDFRHLLKMRLHHHGNQSAPISIENSFDRSRLMLTIILTVGVMQIMDGLSDSAAQDSRLYL